MSVFWYQVYQVRLWERLFTLQGLPSNSKCVLKAESGKLGIKRRTPGIILISLLSWLPLQLGEYDVIIDFFVLSQRHWRRHLISAMSSWPDIVTCDEIDNVYLQRATMQLIWMVTDKTRKHSLTGEICTDKFWVINRTTLIRMSMALFHSRRNAIW